MDKIVIDCRQSPCMVDFWVNIDSGIFFLMQDVFVNAEFCKSTCGAGLV